MTRPEDDEVVSMVLALEEVVQTNDLGRYGMRFMCKEAARLIRRLRPDLAFTEELPTAADVRGILADR